MFNPKELTPAVSTATLYNPTQSTDDASTDSPQRQNFTDADLPAHEYDWYEAFIYTKSLGVVFFDTSQVISSLFLNMDPQTVTILKNRPVVSFTVEGSPACHAGIQLGSILIKVNGYPVDNSIHAMQMIKSMKERPLSLLFYRPEVKLCITEGVYFTCDNTKDFSVPSSQSKWKMNYVVIGGVISKPWFLSMYYSKADYDIAVIEIQSLRSLSVKVKQVCLKDSKIMIQSEGGHSYYAQSRESGDDYIGKVSYSDDSKPLYYLIISPLRGYPIKIASTKLSQLTLILNEVKRINEIY